MDGYVEIPISEYRELCEKAAKLEIIKNYNGSSLFVSSLVDAVCREMEENDDDLRKADEDSDGN